MTLPTRLWILCSLLATAAPDLTAQRLLADLAPNTPARTGSVGPASTNIGALTLFTCDDGVFGEELWATDGTSAGTRLVADLEPGPVGSVPTDFVGLGSFALFQAATSDGGIGLWRSDGTRGGTSRVAVLGRGLTTQQGLGALRFGAGALFGTPTDERAALWFSDGTPAGTRLIRTFDYLSLRDAALRGNEAWFTGSVSGFTGAEPWVSDGTGAGTRLVVDLRGPDASSLPASYVAFRGQMGFVAYTEGVGYELMISDGTASGTRVLAGQNLGFFGRSFNFVGKLGADLVFQTSGGTPNDKGTLWLADAGTGAVRKLLDATQAPFQASYGMLAFAFGKSVVLMVLNANSVQFWNLGPAPDDLRFLVSIPRGAIAQAPTRCFAANGRFYWTFRSFTSNPNSQLWSTDGTAAGTRMVHTTPNDVFASVAPLVGVNGKVLFVDVLSETPIVRRGDLWVSDGTQNGTSPLFQPRPFEVTHDLFTMPGLPAAVGDLGIFAGWDPLHGMEPWVTDGTAAGTHLILDLEPGVEPSLTEMSILSLGDRAVFSTYSLVNRGLWVTDGTAAGTRRISSTLAGIAKPVRPPVRVGGKLFFLVVSPTPALAVTDGTAGGTRMLGSAEYDSPLCRFGNGVVYVDSMTRWTRGETLVMFSDGTAAGTRILHVFANPGPGTLGAVHCAVEQGGKLWFTTNSNGSDQLQVYDPATNAVRSVGAPDKESPTMTGLVSTGADLYFTRRAGVPAAEWLPLRDELWVLPAGASQPRRVRSFTGLSGPTGGVHSLVATAKGVLFVADDPATGTEVWRSGGTAATTVPIEAGMPGPTSSCDAATTLVRVGVGDRFVFAAQDATFGRELWLTDGTRAGTVRLSDLEVGPGSASPREFAAVGNKLYLRAYTRATGDELYVIDMKSLGAAVVDPVGVGCSVTSPVPPVLDVNGLPSLGNLGFAVVASAAPKNAPAVWILGSQGAVTGIGVCVLRVAPPFVTVAATTTATGTATLPLPLPNSAALLGLSLHAQGSFVDGSGLALTQSLRLIVGLP